MCLSKAVNRFPFPLTRGKGKEDWRKVVKWYKLPVIREISTRYVIYNMIHIMMYVIYERCLESKS